ITVHKRPPFDQSGRRRLPCNLHVDLFADCYGYHGRPYSRLLFRTNRIGAVMKADPQPPSIDTHSDRDDCAKLLKEYKLPLDVSFEVCCTSLQTAHTPRVRH